MSEPVKPTPFTWAIYLLGNKLNGPELTDEQAEALVRNALKIATALIALSPSAAGIDTKDVQ